jgi:hypothetical protein
VPGMSDATRPSVRAMTRKTPRKRDKTRRRAIRMESPAIRSKEKNEQPPETVTEQEIPERETARERQR